LADQPTPETQRRLLVLLENLGTELSGDQLRASRAIQLLEHIGTPESRNFLEELAQGATEARQTAEAKAALEQWIKRGGTRP
jgi:hypothetical protein